MSETPQTQPVASAEGEGYAFVMNVGRLSDSTSYELAPGHELRRASASEVAVIKETLRSIVADIHFGLRGGYLWEMQLPHERGPIQWLPEQDWRYFVIGFTGNNQTLVRISQAFDLARLELEVGLTVMSIGGTANGRMWNTSRLFHVLEGPLFNDSFFVDVSEADIEEVRTIQSQLREHDRTLLNVDALAAQLGQLKGFPHSSPLRFLGYFALLESLLTHAPKPADPYDSITRQVRNKLALLNHRLSRRIDYSPFGEVPAETVWTKMYAYRSQLAHGGSPQFTGDLQALVSHDAALTLIRETAKAVIRQALREPQLLLDLRNC